MIGELSLDLTTNANPIGVSRGYWNADWLRFAIHVIGTLRLQTQSFDSPGAIDAAVDALAEAIRVADAVAVSTRVRNFSGLRLPPRVVAFVRERRSFRTI